MTSLALFFLGAGVAAGQSHAGFDAASASSIAVGDYGAANAVSAGSGYWCSAGGHGQGQSVRWTGKLNVAHSIVGVRLNWAYAPGEFKILTSEDGTNFEEAVCARAPSQGTPSFVETVMLAEPKRAVAVAVVMQSPKSWRYFGINDASLLVEPYAFMLVSGMAASSGESCLVAQGKALATQSCLSSIAAGDGREVFKLESDGSLAHLPSKQCVAAVGGALALQSCAAAARANDGRSAWSIAASGEIQLSQTPEMCLSTATGKPGIAACSGLGDAGKWSLVAVPEHDPTAATVMKYGAAALKSSLARQQGLVGELRGLLPKLASCKLAPSLASNVTMPTALVAGAAARVRVGTNGQDAASDVYAAFGVDMSEVGSVIAEAAGVLGTVQGKLTHAA